MAVMNVSDFFEEGDIAEAPEHGPDAFAFLVEKAQRKLTSYIHNVEDEQDGWREVQAAQYSFMNVVTALARSYEVEPFATVMPVQKNFTTETYEQFRHDLDFYLTQLMVGKVRRQKLDSIVAYDVVRESIRTHLHHIKTHIDKAEMSEAKRAALHRKLSEFEAALGKSHLNILAVARFVMEIMSLSANGLAVADSATLHRLTTNVLGTVAHAKAEQDATRALDAPTPRFIEASIAVREPEPDLGYGKVGFRPKAQPNFDLDDEIPF